MKRIFICGVAVALIGVATFNVVLSIKSEKKLSDLHLAEVEAIAVPETSANRYYNIAECTCSNGKKGYTVACTTTESTEPCTTSFVHCYRITATIGWPPVQGEVCD